jgi:radical SAM protein with 4Fe4S-binding SPASM domain
VQRTKDLWQLQNVQITLDGTEQTYNNVKNYVYKKTNAFEKVLKNIKLLTDKDIKVVIRLNVDKHNIDEMAQLITLLHNRFGTNKFLSIYSCEIYGKRTPKDNAALYNQRMQLEQQIEMCNYKTTRKLPKDIKLNRCMADYDRSAVISPDGHLGKCEHYVDSEFFGHINSEDRDKEVLRRFKERRADIEACANCSYYPQCFWLLMCPNHDDCTPELQKEHIYNIKEAMKNEYQRYINNNNKNEQEDETEI